MNFGGTIRLNRVGLCIIIGGCISLFLYLNTYNKIHTSEDTKTETGKSVNSVNLRKLLIASIEVAEKGGKKVVAIRKEHDIKEEIKGKLQGGVDDPVTKADLQSHCIMYYSIKQGFPKLKVISEESLAESDCPGGVPLLEFNSGLSLEAKSLPDDYAPAEDVTVWIDPLDATKEYTEKKLEYVTTMVCIAIAGKPTIGVIHKPFQPEPNTYWAWVGKPIPKELKYSKQVDKNLKIIVSLSHAGPAKNVTEQLIGKSATVVSAAGAGYKSLELVQGKVSAYLHLTDIKKWDTCAGNAIIKAVGGRMTTLSNNEIDYSPNSDPVNKEGLLATLDKHAWFIQQFEKARPKP
ncbi:putative inositol monophosphatase 3 [Anabrus simplex]|uniref:putative inositol monophosphatase 3 n=1 Tax=Anabrus simplex TaxID=316456 RepID=UPI0034DD9B0E